jgi:endogenous inhibitor of DNA gyrase (YacG/DUF329 family)
MDELLNPSAPRKVPCPSCGTPTPFTPDNAWRPFCSARCRQADLGAWASERFRVPVQPPGDDEAAAEGP